VGDAAGVAEAGSSAVHAMLAAAGAVWRCGKVHHRIGVEHRPHHLDEYQVGDCEQDQRGEELPRQCGEPQLAGQRVGRNP
jgi:hypothetical protein